jgi:hypothetical protein
VKRCAGMCDRKHVIMCKTGFSHCVSGKNVIIILFVVQQNCLLHLHAHVIRSQIISYL